METATGIVTTASGRQMSCKCEASLAKQQDSLVNSIQVAEANTFNYSTRGAETGRSLSGVQPGLQSEFQDNQGYTEKPSLKNTNKSGNLKTKVLNGPPTILGAMLKFISIPSGLLLSISRWTLSFFFFNIYFFIMYTIFCLYACRPEEGTSPHYRWL